MKKVVGNILRSINILWLVEYSWILIQIYRGAVDVFFGSMVLVVSACIGLLLHDVGVKMLNEKKHGNVVMVDFKRADQYKTDQPSPAREEYHTRLRDVKGTYIDVMALGGYLDDGTEY